MFPFHLEEQAVCRYRIDEASADDMSAIGDELDPDEWFALVDQYGLVKSES